MRHRFKLPSIFPYGVLALSLVLAPAWAVQAQDDKKEDEGEAAAVAQFECKSSVSYSWEPDEEMVAEDMGGKASDDAASTGEKVTILYSSRAAVAESEEAARAQLAKMLERDLEAARTQCKREHENLSGCVASKHQAMSSVMRQLDFSARKTLTDSIQKDCQKQTGRCMKTETSEVACKNMNPQAAEGEGEEEDGKGKKKKKK